MTSSRRLLGWLLILGIGGGVLFFTLIWTIASSRTPAAPAPLGEELDIGFFDPHLHIRLVEVTELGALPEVEPPASGYRRLAVRLQARSSAVELFADPSRLSITVRSAGRATGPVTSGVSEIDGLRVQTGFENVLEAGEFQEAWFIFELPIDLDSPELWLSKRSWLARNFYGWEAGPLHDKAVFALDPASTPVEGADPR
jgi:hypothetical protein